MSKMKAFLERASLLGFGCFLALLLAELCLRLVGIGGRPAELPPTFDRIARQYYPDESELNPWVDADDTEVLRLAVVGDSFTVGVANGWDDAYPWRLQRLLNMNGDTPPAEVRVFGRAGTATADQFPLFRRAMAYEPDLFLLGIYLNDPEDPRDPDRELWRDRSLPRQPTGWHLRALKMSRLAEWVFMRVENRRIRQSIEARMQVLYDRESPGWRKFTRALSLFARDSGAQDVQMVAVIFPAMGGLLSHQHYPHGWAHQQIGQELDRLEVPYLDLLDSFIGTADVRMAAYPGIDSHPSEIGHRLAARRIFEWLLNRGLIDPSYQPHNTRPEQRDWIGLTRRIRSPLYP